MYCPVEFHIQPDGRQSSTVHVTNCYINYIVVFYKTFYYVGLTVFSLSCSFAGPNILFTILLADVLSDSPKARDRTLRLRKITSRIIVFVQKVW